MIDLTWYYTLKQPFLTPPPYVFPAAWIILYLMIFSAFLIFFFKTTERSKCWGYLLFAIQMILNLCWSPVFFGLHIISLGLSIIIALDVFVLLTIMEFYRVSKLAAYFLIPYFLWIVFATYLNFGFYVLNF